MSREDFNRSLVNGLADALNDRDFTNARSYLADDLHFVGVFGPPIEGADAYIDAMRRLDAQQTVLKCLAEYDEVACFYELALPARPDVRWGGRPQRHRCAIMRVVRTGNKGAARDEH